MRILDSNNNELTSYDSSLGWLKPDKLFIKHHEAIEAVEEICHYEVVTEYPNGGKDVEMVVDVPAVESKPAWDEYEEILRYTPYTEEELAIRNQPTPQDDIDSMMVDHEYRLTLLELGV